MEQAAKEQEDDIARFSYLVEGTRLNFMGDIMKHWRNICYIIRHKWFVLVECWKRGLYIRGLLHDLSKFTPREFKAYSNYFFDIQQAPRPKEGYKKPAKTTEEFDVAWMHHVRRNDHHWQYWVVVLDDTGVVRPAVVARKMPIKVVTEMLCDWIGAGKAQRFGNNTKIWWRKHNKSMILHPDTRAWLENQINSMP